MEKSAISDVVFLDTSAIFALCHPGDAHHARITAFFHDITAGKIPTPAACVLSNLVLAELLTLASRARIPGRGLALQEKILSSPDYRVVWVDIGLYREGCHLLDKFSAQRLSFTDAVSFAIMRREKISHAVTFDTDFAKAGFRMLP